MAGNQPEVKPLTPGQALGKLGSVPYGRVVFTQHALPAVRLVHHLVDGGQVIIRTREGAAIADGSGRRGTVVAYETDQADPTSGTAWSVVVTGIARLVDDPQQAARYRQALHPGEIDDMSDTIIRIDPQIVTGYQHSGIGTAAIPLTCHRPAHSPAQTGSPVARPRRRRHCASSGR